MKTTKGINNFIMFSTGIILILLLYFFGAAEMLDHPNAVAVIDKKEISFSQFREMVKNAQHELSFSEKKDLLDFMVNQQLIIKFSEMSGITEREIRPLLDKEEKYAKENLVIKELLNSDIEIGSRYDESDIKKYYIHADYIALYAITNNSPRGQFIMQAAYSQLEKGVPFLEVVNAYATPDKKGESSFLGYFSKNEPNMSPPVSDYALTLAREGDFSPVFVSNQGFTILYRSSDPLYENVRNLIVKNMNELQENKGKKAFWKNLAENIELNKNAIDKIAEKTNSELEALAANDLTLAEVKNYGLRINFGDFSAYAREVIKLGNYGFVSSAALSNYVQDYASRLQLIEIAKAREIEKTKNFKLLWGAEQKRLKEGEGPLIVQYVLDKKNIEITENEIRQFYEMHKRDYARPALLDVQKIILPNYDIAKQIKTKLQSGTDFSNAVLKYSLEKGKNQTLGKTGYLTKEEIGKPYEQLTLLPLNGLSPIMHEKDGYVIYKVLAHMQGGEFSYQEARESVRTRLASEKLNTWLDGQPQKMGIKVKKFYERLKKI